MVAGKAHQHLQLVMEALGRLVLQQAQVLPVHHQDHVVVLEVFHRDLAGAQIGDVIAAPRHGHLGTRISRLALMEGMGTGRADADHRFQPCLTDLMAKHPVRHRRPTDVAHTDEQHSSGHRHGQWFSLSHFDYLISIWIEMLAFWSLFKARPPGRHRDS